MDGGATEAAAVVVVDDDEAMRTLVRVAVEASGCGVVVAEADDGLAAIAAAGHHQPDVVVLDAMMPNMGGLEALPAIRAIARESVVVVFSATLDEAIAAEAAEAGAHHFISKVDPIGDLLEVIRSAPRRARVAPRSVDLVDAEADAVARTGAAVEAQHGEPRRHRGSLLGRRRKT